MPEKNPDVWTQIYSALAYHFSNHNQLICGVVIAFFTSLTKSFLYGKKDTPRRVLAEAVLCSIIAGSMQPVLIWLKLGTDMITPFGAAIGLLGTSMIRQLILKFVNRKIGADDANQ